METHPLSAHEVLDFVIRHSAHRSLQTLADVARVNAGNLRKSLAQTRSMPTEHMRRLAVAAGLRLHIGDGQNLRLTVEEDTVAYLEVNLNELQQAAAVVHALGNRPAKWRFVAASAKNGLFMTALAYVQAGESRRGYVAVHITDPIQSAGMGVIQEQLAGLAPVAVDESLTASDSKWIRLRSGMESARELDLLYRVGDEPQPTALDWAQVLMVAHELELGPGDVIRAMRDQHASFLSSLS